MTPVHRSTRLSSSARSRLAAFALSLSLFAGLAIPSTAQRNNQSGSGSYFPGQDRDWEKRSPAQLGLNGAKIDEAVALAKSTEVKQPRNLELAHYQTFGREPFGVAVGPFSERGDATGLIVYRGYIVAEWGEPDRIDMTFSVTKSFLSTTAGLAFDRGLIKDLQEPVYTRMPPVLALGSDSNPAERMGQPQTIKLFDTEHNRRINWEHLLRQTSDWEGTLWGKPDWADRPSNNPSEWWTRKRREPGSVYKYNDVRVNVLALALLNIWRRPLPQVLKEMVMDPIGASNTWRWFGYRNSWVELDASPVQSVSGGGHWGGGMFINARDLARFGLLTLHRGKWKDKQILSDAWVKMALTPTSVEPTYGFMNWFLNTDKKLFASAPVTAFAHIGNGPNIVYVDPENDLVIVTRWSERAAFDGIVQKVIAAKSGVAEAGHGTK